MKSLLTLCISLTLFATDAVLAQSPNSAAQVFPTKEIRLVVPYGPGGASDRAARMIASIAQKNDLIKQPIIVTNIAGAATKAGLGAVAKADADGHTLLLHHNAFITAGVLKQLEPELTWQNGFRPVAQVLETPLTFAVLATSRWKTTKELFDEISAQPGKVKFGFPGVNAPQSFALQAVLGEMSKDGQKRRVHSVYLEGGAAVKTASLGGVVDVVAGITMDTVPEAKAGVYRILSVVADKRLQSLPDAPTLAEAGYPTPPNGSGALRMIVWAPKGTPDAIVSRLQGVLDRVYKSKEWAEFAQQMSAVALWRTPEEVAKVFAMDEKIAIEALPAMQAK
jgi:tripartite-type tricarboxylate transporter receptor subunit TctC